VLVDQMVSGSTLMVPYTMFVMIMVCLKTYKGAEDRKVLLGHPHIIKVVGIRDVELQFTSGKKVVSQ
jgi:hypothetical protein